MRPILPYSKNLRKIGFCDSNVRFCVGFGFALLSGVIQFFLMSFLVSTPGVPSVLFPAHAFLHPVTTLVDFNLSKLLNEL